MKFVNDKGVSIIGTLFTLIILGVLGAALVALVSMDQESRMKSIKREYAFYAVQAAFEYALREIKEGGYPIVNNKVLGQAKFTTGIAPLQRKITAVGVASDVQRTHSITTDLLAGDCAEIDISGAVVGGSSGNELQNVVIDKTCLNAINIDKMTFSISPNLGETVRGIRIDGIDVYDDMSGISSGSPIDILDYRITGSAVVNFIKFSSGISGKTIDISVTFTDSSAKSRSVTLP
ncbi:MAG TPA: hypothetical protein PKU96_04475 [bacterium]|jgi:type II secretory pathway pseudopilin PulG|nr:hypothetical protein [Myxococcales bacterium]OQA61911.1 MAG: hypothetical protein BWY40_00382 [bacterium ADurb.Bin270]HPW45608.1 hypothetical protein [bacterium]HQG13621.1 hypothetical protein [bacterium]